MVKRPRMIRQSELLNQLVLDRNTMEELGQIEVVWMYPQVHRVLGFVCHSGFLGKQKAAFKLKHITALGENSVLVTAKPTETDAERVRQLESLVHCEVWSDQGNRVGQIIDFVFDLETGEIQSYLLVAGRLAALTDGIYQLPPRKIISLGRKRVLIAEATIARLDLYRGGIRQTLTKTGEWLKSDLEQVTEELQAWRHEVQVKTQQLGETLQGWVSRVKQSTRDWTQETLEQARKTGQSWVEQVKESRSSWELPIPPSACENLGDAFAINLTAAEQAEQAAAAKARANLLDEDDFDFDFNFDADQGDGTGEDTQNTTPQATAETVASASTPTEDEWDWDWNTDEPESLKTGGDQSSPSMPPPTPTLKEKDNDEWDWDDI
ncbi:PRC-barrel domain-containing protein [Trichothermofontia sichuanensis B231]|uniref:PRC-barrel domain-containing protein n=1 Tax=Trichothermofontia sichuanensis TaxID=3045816 RepID=UPI0022486EAA|nr:PRC-barrel domain-containing protein [Trichothermofontia sichuanensis]UZQ52808.1 PRC-barrel domain-containing protein [Trichothermofontia sichuanensis B231]